MEFISLVKSIFLFKDLKKPKAFINFRLKKKSLCHQQHPVKLCVTNDKSKLKLLIINKL